jgi:hypothetical protein
MMTVLVDDYEQARLTNINQNLVIIESKDMSKESESDKFVLKGVTFHVSPLPLTKKQRDAYEGNEVPSHQLSVEVFGTELVKPTRMKRVVSTLELDGQKLEFNNNEGFISFEQFHQLYKNVCRIEKGK